MDKILLHLSFPFSELRSQVTAVDFHKNFNYSYFDDATLMHFTQVFQWVKIIKYEVHPYTLENLFNIKSSRQSMSQQGP